MVGNNQDDEISQIGQIDVLVNEHDDRFNQRAGSAR